MNIRSIPFPIPTEEYPRIIEMLEALEVGDVLKSDCLHIVGSSFGVDLEEYLNTKYETIQSLNSMCEAAAGISTEKLGAIIRSTSPESTEHIVVLAQDADSFDFYPGIKTPEDYGRYFIQSSDRYEYDDELGEYYDYERFGKDRIAREHGVFDEAGYIAYNGTLGFDEIMEQDNNMAMEEIT